MKRSLKVAAVAATAAVALALSACSGSSSNSAHKVVTADPNAKVQYNGTLSVLTKFGLQQLAPYFQNLAKQYENMHPGVTVKLDQESDDSVKGKTKTLVASNSLPDIYFSWTGNWGENFVRGSRAVDLTKVIGPGTAWGEQLSPSAVKAFEYNGKYYGIPLYLDGKFMGYNKAAFVKAGISSPPDNFDQLLSDCDAIKKTGMTPISLGNKEAWPVLHYVGQLLAYDVPETTLEQDFDPAKAKYSDPGYVTALEQFKQLEQQCTDGSAMNGESYASALQAFSNTKSAMYYQEILEFDQSAEDGTPLKKQDFGFFQLPAPSGAKGNPNAVEGAPEGYMINSASKHIPLAIDFMKYVTSQANAKVLSAPPFGQPSAVVGAVTTSTSSPTVVQGVKDINGSPFLMPWLDTANTPTVAAAWLSSLQAMANGSMSPQQVMSKVRSAASSGSS